MAHAPGPIILDGLAKFGLRVHHKWAVTGHGLANRLAAENQNYRIRSGFDFDRIAGRAQHGEPRFALRFARLPTALRRLMWWLALEVDGASRARKVGTFAVSVYSGLGAESLHPLSPLTATLNYGVIGPDGTVPVRIIYDHRVMDGSTVARALARLETILDQDMADELMARPREPPEAKLVKLFEGFCSPSPLPPP